MANVETCECNSRRTERPVLINCDEESWVLGSLERLVKMVLAIDTAGCGGWKVKEQAIKGAIHGAAADVLSAVGLDTDYINIKKY